VRLLLRNGKAVPLAPKVFETLVILVESSGHTLEKDELMKRLWPDTFVEESSLAQNIFQLRKALKEGRSGRRYIETVPKRGYRFSADVRKIMQSDDEAASSYPTNGRFLIKEDETGLAVKSLVVLPFKPLGENESVDEYLGLGMADATIIKLSGLRQLVVVPTSTMFKYAWRKNDPQAVGRKLGVDAVLQGTIQRAGERVRVTVQLISLNDGKTVWSGKFDEHFTDIFAVQDSISEQVAGALALRITGAERRHLRKRYTENTEAYQAYLMGLFFWNKKSKEGLNKALEYFQQAIEKDPNYALAYAGLADSYFWIAYSEFDTLTPISFISLAIMMKLSDTAKGRSPSSQTSSRLYSCSASVMSRRECLRKPSPSLVKRKMPTSIVRSRWNYSGMCSPSQVKKMKPKWCCQSFIRPRNNMAFIHITSR
jgi:TolB-like protein